MEKAPLPRKDYSFEFTGNAYEYFRIWIVNILLTILTLGIYSAWAKVRNHQYFYGNTLVDGSSFEYTASPIQILKGRLLAVAVVIAYQLAGYLSVTAGFIASFIFLLLIPALIVLSLRFRMHYTSWRSITFGFQPDFKTAYLLFGVPLLILVVFFAVAFGLLPESVTAAGTVASEPGAAPLAPPSTQDIVALLLFSAPLVVFALGFPAWQKMYFQFVANRVRYGSAAFGFIATTGAFYAIYLVAGAISIGGVVLAVAFIGLLSVVGLAGVAATLSVVLFVLPVIVANAYVQTQRTNLIYSSVELGPVGFSSQLKVGRMLFLYLTNSLAIVLSLGLMIPWAMVRMAKYRAETMTLRASDLAGFQAAAAADLSARGEEIGDMFDLEIGI